MTYRPDGRGPSIPFPFPLVHLALLVRDPGRTGWAIRTRCPAIRMATTAPEVAAAQPRKPLLAYRDGAGLVVGEPVPT